MSLLQVQMHTCLPNLTTQNDWNTDPLTINSRGFRAERSTTQLRIVDENDEIPTFDLHSGIYNFFTNLDSSLDRIRLELNSIYFYGYKEADGGSSKGNRLWQQYLNPRNNKIGLLRTKGYSALVAILTDATSISLNDRTSKYRNRLIHDGDLEININKSTGKVFLPEDPLTTPLTFSIELLPYLKLIFSDLQILMEQIYAQVIIDINSKTILPLVL